MPEQLGLALDQDPPKARRTAALTSFHPRDESPAEALAGERRAASQEDAVLGLFMSLRAGTALTPWDVSERLGICINSARRALTNMADRGELLHDARNRVPAGPYGQRSGTWRLA